MGLLQRRQPDETATEHMEDAMSRQAGAIAEVQRIHADNIRLNTQAYEDQRQIDRLEDRCALLTSELEKAQQDGKVYQRKLIRLAAAMAGIGRLTQDAVEIMQSCQEWQETEQERSEQTDQKTAADIVASLPQRQG